MEPIFPFPATTPGEQLRALMPVSRKWAYFDHAAVAPISQPAADAMALWMRQACEEGDTAWHEWKAQVQDARETGARLIGAEADEIALTANTTTGINFVAEGLDWRPGDNVVTLDDEFPTNLYPWMNLADRGVETRLTPTADGRVDCDELARRCNERTRVLSISWVGYSTGCRRDLDRVAEVARQSGALLMVDAIQGLGVFPLDVRRTPIDFLSADGHKWLLGPEGAGVAYIRRERLSLLRPTGVGWNSVEQANDYSRIELRLKPNAGRYEGGSYNMAGVIGLGASLKMLETLGVDNLATAILDITDRACEELLRLGARIASPHGGNERSGIVAFDLPGADPQTVRKHCLARGVVFGCRGGRLRISAHAYNDLSDLERLVDALKSAR